MGICPQGGFFLPGNCAPMSEAAIRVENISYSYGDIEAVKGVSYGVQRG